MKNKLDNKKNRTQPVLMIPLRRCGSHAIRLRLGLNTDFYSPYPLHIVDIMDLLPLYGDLSIDNNYFQLIVDVIGLQALSLVKWDGITIDPIEFFEKIRNLPRSIHTVNWEILIHAAQQKGCRVVMDKSLDNVHAWRELMELYPNILFINLIRDPRAQVSSMNRAIIHEFNTLLNTEILLKAHKAADELIQAFPERVLSIRYEDFIYDEEETTRKLCSFLRIRFSKKMLDIQRSEEAGKISRQSSLWESNRFKPIKKNVEKFRTNLSSSEIQLIETMTSQIMEKYGYERITHGSAQISESDWFRAKEDSAAKRIQAWEELRALNYNDYILRRRRLDYISMCRSNLNRSLNTKKP